MRSRLPIVVCDCPHYLFSGSTSSLLLFLILFPYWTINYILDGNYHRLHTAIGVTLIFDCDREFINHHRDLLRSSGRDQEELANYMLHIWWAVIFLYLKPTTFLTMNFISYQIDTQFSCSLSIASNFYQFSQHFIYSLQSIIELWIVVGRSFHSIDRTCITFRLNHNCRQPSCQPPAPIGSCCHP